jgi:putative transposase
MAEQQWFSIRTISQIAAQVGAGVCPTSVKGLLTMAARDKWESRRRAGRGGGREFHIDSLPDLVRAALSLNLDRPAAPKNDSWNGGRPENSDPCAANRRSADRLPIVTSKDNSSLSDAAVSSPMPRDWRAVGDDAECCPPSPASDPAAASGTSEPLALDIENSLSDAVVPIPPLTPRDRRADGDGVAGVPPSSAPEPAAASDISLSLGAGLSPAAHRAGDLISTPGAAAATVNPEIDLQRKLLWQSFERAPESKQRVATMRAGVARAVASRAEVVGWKWAYEEVAGEKDLPIATVRRWSEDCRAFDRADYPAVLLDKRRGRIRDASYDERIWDWFLKDYGRNEEPAAMAVYRRVAEIAARENLPMPVLATLKRRWDKLPRRVRMLLRKGPRAARATFPHQTRSVAHLEAMQACNADGHIFDVFVKFPDGEIGRPILAAIQDLYSRMIVAWRIGKTESGDLVRMTYFDAIDKFGVFKNVYLDNGRAWMTKQMTGGMKHRYRFRRRDPLMEREEFIGVLNLLDITPHPCEPEHGQSKPIERSFGDFATEKIARHPLCKGAYTGNNPTAKPENYGSKAVPFAEFAALVDRQIMLHNQQPGRRTEVCRGILSFEQAFMESWKTTVPRMLAPSQKFLFLMKSEVVTVRKPVGEIELFGNRFTSAAVAELAGQKVVARFDPMHIHSGIRVYRLDGSFVGEAECIDPVGYDDIDAARDHNRAVRQHVKDARKFAEAEMRISDAEFRRLNSVAPEAPLRPRPTTTRIIPDAPRIERELPKANTASVQRLQRISAAAKDQNEERRRSGAA